jgi:hypothetical protein
VCCGAWHWAQVDRPTYRALAIALEGNTLNQSQANDAAAATGTASTANNNFQRIVLHAGVPLLAAHRIALNSDSHCSLLSRRFPREASSAVLDYVSPFLRREQWHTELSQSQNIH